MPKICDLPKSQAEWRTVSHTLRKARRDMRGNVGCTLMAGDGWRYIYSDFKGVPLAVYNGRGGTTCLTYAAHARRRYQEGWGRSYAQDARSWLRAAKREREDVQ
jgi:hypothetical protein